MTEHSFHGIHFPPRKGKKCNLCARYDLSPMCRVGHNHSDTPQTPNLFHSVPINNPILPPEFASASLVRAHAFLRAEIRTDTNSGRKNNSRSAASGKPRNNGGSTRSKTPRLRGSRDLADHLLELQLQVWVSGFTAEEAVSDRLAALCPTTRSRK